jgi:hypothetical protein
MKIEVAFVLSPYNLNLLTNLSEATADDFAVMNAKYVPDDYHVVGTAMVEVEFLPAEEIQANTLLKLTQLRQKGLAENQTRLNAVEDKIAKLSALTHDSQV